MGGVKGNLYEIEYMKQISFLRGFICQNLLSMTVLHFTRELLYSFYLHLLKWFENDYFPMKLWLKPNREVHCNFYSVILMKKVFLGGRWVG